MVMPEMDGIQVLEVLADYKVKAAIVLMSGADNQPVERPKPLPGSLIFASLVCFTNRFAWPMFRAFWPRTERKTGGCLPLIQLPAKFHSKLTPFAVVR